MYNSWSYQSFLPGSHGMVCYILLSFFLFFFFSFFPFFFFAMLANQFGDVTTRFHFTTYFVLCAHVCATSIPFGISLLMQIFFVRVKNFLSVQFSMNFKCNFISNSVQIYICISKFCNISVLIEICKISFQFHLVQFKCCSLLNISFFTVSMNLN